MNQGEEGGTEFRDLEGGRRSMFTPGSEGFLVWHGQPADEMTKTLVADAERAVQEVEKMKKGGVALFMHQVGTIDFRKPVIKTANDGKARVPVFLAMHGTNPVTMLYAAQAILEMIKRDMQGAGMTGSATRLNSAIEVLRYEINSAYEGLNTAHQKALEKKMEDYISKPQEGKQERS